MLEVAGTVVTAMLSYHLLENPIRRSKRLAADRVAVALVLCVCVAASWATAIIVAAVAATDHVGCSNRSAAPTPGPYQPVITAGLVGASRT